MTLLLGYNTNGFAHHRLEDALDVLAGIGYRSVGLTIDVHHAPPDSTDFGRLGAALEERGLLPVVETGARFLLDPRRKHRPSLLSEFGRPKRVDFYLRCLDAAKDLGARCLSLWSGAGEGGEPWERLVAGLGVVCDRAESLGLDVGFEPEPGMFVGSMEQFAELRRRLPHPRLKLTLDVGHLFCVEAEEPAFWIDRAGGDLVNVHLDDHRRGVHEHLAFGDGAIDFRPVWAALRRAAEGRDLPATVELPRHSHDAVETARRAWRFFEALGQSAG